MGFVLKSGSDPPDGSVDRSDNIDAKQQGSSSSESKNICTILGQSQFKGKSINLKNAEVIRCLLTLTALPLMSAL